MVKARRGLILSLLTLLVAIVVTTTSTYAWFAMNTSVTATNMQVTVVADNNYLIISNAAPAGGVFTSSDVATTATTTTANANVLPTKLKTGSTAANMTWQTAAGTSLTDGSALGGNYTDIASDKVGSYVAKSSFWIGLNPAYSAVDASALKITNIAIAKASNAASDEFLKAVSFVVVCGNAIDDYANTTGTLTPNNTVLASTISSLGTAIQVDVYVYINGDCPAVTSQNASAALGGYTLALTFGVTAGTVA